MNRRIEINNNKKGNIIGYFLIFAWVLICIGIYIIFGKI